MAALNHMPGHLIRRFHQAAVAIFHKEVGERGYDLTPVQYAALAEVGLHAGIDQVSLAGLIAYDRTTITGVVERLVQKRLLVRHISDTDRRARSLQLTARGRKALRDVTPAVEDAQAIMLQGLDGDEAAEFLRLLHKATLAVNELSRAPLKETALA